MRLRLYGRLRQSGYPWVEGTDKSAADPGQDPGGMEENALAKPARLHTPPHSKARCRFLPSKDCHCSFHCPQDPTRKALLQPIVASEASWLDTVYSTTLYGGRTLDDSAQLGAHDNNVGSLFVAEHHAEMLFSSQACLRSAMQTCVAQSDRFYEVCRVPCGGLVGGRGYDFGEERG